MRVSLTCGPLGALAWPFALAGAKAAAALTPTPHPGPPTEDCPEPVLRARLAAGLYWMPSSSEEEKVSTTPWRAGRVMLRPRFDTLGCHFIPAGFDFSG